MKDIFILLTLVGLLIVSSVAGGFVFGSAYKQMLVKKALPKQMELLCLECQAVGREEGYKGGLKTCDDVLGKLDSDGRY